MSSILDVADDLWTGARSIEDTHPFSLLGDAEEVADGVAFVPSFANVAGFSTEQGLVLVDTGSAPLAQHIHTTLRRWTAAPLHTAVFSHGHIDHVFGVAPFEQEATEKGWAAPLVVAHEAMPARFDRYQLTAGYNEIVNQRQFAMPDLRWPPLLPLPGPDLRGRHRGIRGRPGPEAAALQGRDGRPHLHLGS